MTLMSAAQLATRIREACLSQGFDVVRIAAAVSPPGFHPLLQWLADGHHADMTWIEQRRDAYRHPDGVLPDTRSVIMVALNYHQAVNTDHVPESPPKIARYAWGQADYHDLIRTKLRPVMSLIRDARPESRSRAVIDTAPLLERDFARLAGIGWFGKNTMLISREIGSWFFLGAILTTVQLPPDAPFEGDYCGSCTRCLEACPTDAFPQPGVLDANRCISYLTIERRDKAIPESLCDGMGDWVFGCDICQEVCPWNRFAPSTTLPELRQQPYLRNLTIKSILQLSEVEFQTAFAGTALQRTGRDAIVRNAAIAAGNRRMTSVIPELRQLAECDPSPIVTQAAAWAMRRIDDGDTRSCHKNTS